MKQYSYRFGEFEGHIRTDLVSTFVYRLFVSMVNLQDPRAFLAASWVLLLAAIAAKKNLGSAMFRPLGLSSCRLVWY